jgi:hypothetical protein
MCEMSNSFPESLGQRVVDAGWCPMVVAGHSRIASQVSHGRTSHEIA